MKREVLEQALLEAIYLLIKEMEENPTVFMKKQLIHFTKKLVELQGDV